MMNVVYNVDHIHR